MILKHFTTIDLASGMLMSWAVQIGAFAMALGVVAIVRLHGGYIAKRTPGQWFYSLWMMIVLIVMTLLGLHGEITAANSLANPGYNWLVNNVYSALGIAEYAITGFFIFSAGFNALKARTWESLFMIIACFGLIFYNTTLPETVWVGFPVFGGWVFSTGSVAALRAILISGSLGGIAFGIRVFTGKERGYAAE